MQAIMEPKRLGFMSNNDEKKDYERMKGGVMEEVRRIFKPEFLNRIDDIMVFHVLNKEDIRKIVTLLLKTLEKRCAEQMDIQLTVTNAVKDFIADKGSDNKYGARPLRRAIQSRIEDALANEIAPLRGSFRNSANIRNPQIYYVNRYFLMLGGLQDQTPFDFATLVSGIVKLV